MLRILLLTGALMAAVPALAAPLAYDTDSDGTIDLNEAKAAAAATFDRLDVDHDGTLDKKELHGRISRRDWRAADPNKDGKVSKDEYLGVVEMLFKSADKDTEGTIDKKELRSQEGKKLERLLK